MHTCVRVCVCVCVYVCVHVRVLSPSSLLPHRTQHYTRAFVRDVSRQSWRYEFKDAFTVGSCRLLGASCCCPSMVKLSSFHAMQCKNFLLGSAFLDWGGFLGLYSPWPGSQIAVEGLLKLNPILILLEFLFRIIWYWCNTVGDSWFTFCCRGRFQCAIHLTTSERSSSYEAWRN